MSNFNQYFRNSGAKMIVSRFFSSADMYNTKNKITSLTHSFIEEEVRPASYYIENKLTATHKVKIEYIINDDGVLRYSEFEVPKEIDGAFIIEGSYRISTNKLNGDYDCRIRMTGTGKQEINFDFDRQYDISKRVLKIKRTNYEQPSEGARPIDIRFDDLDKALGDPKKQEYLKLTEKQSKKLQIKLDLDYKPTHITQKLILDCLAFGDDRLHDLIIDKKLESVPSSFMQFLFRDNNGRNYFKARRQITSYFTKYGKLQDQINAITNLCFRFWKGSAEASSKEIQVPPGVNSINLESLTSKVVLPKSVAFNSSFTDLIDIADTPINNSTNIINSLTVSCHVTDEDVLFDVYTKDFQKVTISYLDYLNSKVVASEFVDYEGNVLRPNSDNEVEVKYRMKRRMVKVDEIDLIDLHPDYRLSATTRRIPFVNYTDSVRISMGTSMLKQSIPLVNAERPLVDTGSNEELRDNILNEKFTHDSGKVKEITEDKIIIEVPGEPDTEVLRRTAIQSVNDVAVYTEPKVKVGQKLKRGDIVTGAVGHEMDTYKSGLNTLVLFHAYHGLVNEDALVVSESYADQMACYSIIDLTIDVRNSSALKWLAPIGTRVKSKDQVAILYKAVRLDEINRTLNEKLGGLFGEEKSISEYTIEDSLKIPNNIEDAVVSDIMIQENLKPDIPKSVKTPDLTFSHTSREVIDAYEKTKDRGVIYSRFPEYIASDTLDPIELDTKNYKTVYTVRVRLIEKAKVKVADKITNRYGRNKLPVKPFPLETSGVRMKYDVLTMKPKSLWQVIW